MTSLIERMKTALEKAKAVVFSDTDADFCAVFLPANLRSIIQALEGAERALAECADDRIPAVPGQSFSAASANELPRRQKIARAALTLIREVTGSHD